MKCPITICDEPFDADFSVRLRDYEPQIIGLTLVDAAGITYAPPPWLAELVTAYILTYGPDLEETQ